jgi:hypothetical protein
VKKSIQDDRFKIQHGRKVLHAKDFHLLNVQYAILHPILSQTPRAPLIEAIARNGVGSHHDIRVGAIGE